MHELPSSHDGWISPMDSQMDSYPMLKSPNWKCFSPIISSSFNMGEQVNEFTSKMEPMKPKRPFLDSYTHKRDHTTVISKDSTLKDFIENYENKVPLTFSTRNSVIAPPQKKLQRHFQTHKSCVTQSRYLKT